MRHSDSTRASVLLDTKDCAAMLGVSTRTLESWRRARTGPKWIALSARACRYRRADIEAWLTDREVSA